MKYSTGADRSPKDIRTFSYQPTKANKKGGKRYASKDIEDQHKVGICTAISMTQNARKALGVKFSADFQYLLQKKYFDKNWKEGSSLSAALKIAKNYGMLPEEYWTLTTEKDRKLSYDKYIVKLQKVTDAEIEELLKKTVKIRAYASVPVDRDLMANAIDESKAGILTRYSLGNEWWRAPVEPIRPPKVQISGHAVTDSNYDGDSFRIANTWGTDWADKGTGFRLQAMYTPTECWIPYYEDAPKHVDEELKKRTELMGRIQNIIQMLLELKNKII
tara:strand:+ start:1021 stop:1845 length:825 start_codon:yes stop_codon:yes gene_type:complete